MVKPEILSPVGNEEMLKAAVLSGADAVYLGAKEFSARRNAENFDSITLLEAVKYCHIRGVKVYLTLNIILKDSELSSALKTATDAFNAGIDGIIVADLGIAKILKEQLPLLPLHASTQLSVHSPSALKPLKDLGFSRVVVAREMSYEGLREICDEAKKLDMEIEAFVHGAAVQASDTHDLAIMSICSAHDHLAESGRHHHLRTKFILNRHLICEIIFRLPLECVLAESCRSVICAQIIWRGLIGLVRKPYYPARSIHLRHSRCSQNIPDRLSGNNRHKVETSSSLVRTQHHPSLRGR